MKSRKGLNVSRPGSKAETAKPDLNIKGFQKAIDPTIQAKIELLAARANAGNSILEYFKNEMEQYNLSQGKSAIPLQFLLSGQPNQEVETTEDHE